MTPDDLPQDTPPAATPTSPHAAAVPAEALETCAREPIHAPGAIQPLGVFLAIDADAVVRFASANAGAWLGLTPDAPIVGESLGAIVGDGAAEGLLALASLDARDAPAMVMVSVGGREVEAAVTEAGDLFHIELMPGESAAHIGRVAVRVQRAVSRVIEASSVVEACQRTADEIRAVTGFDRVKVYHFDPDWNGEVVAEARADDVESYLGLHFPADDIPAQARALYARVPTRAIADVGYVPVPLVPPLGADEAPLDLSRSVLRSVSPVHIEYLRNMGVGASMSVSVLREGQLWGLVACHHRVPHAISQSTQSACALIGRMLGVVVERHRVSDQHEAQQTRQGHMTRLVEGLLRTDEVMTGLRENADALLSLVGASGAALVSGDDVHRVGITPDATAVRTLARWVQETATDGVYATSTLGREHASGAALRETASGVLAVTLARRQRHVVLWFRPEEPRTVTWAGAPSTDVRVDADGALRLHPRMSFDAWRTLRRGVARAWTDDEHAAASALRRTIQDLVYERLDEIQRLNRRLNLANSTLEARNRELQDFAFIASHDLREPLRKIQVFSSLVLSDFSSLLPDEGRAFLQRIESAGERMSRLVGALLEFSRIVTHGRAFEDVALGALVRDVLADLDLAIEQTGARIEASGPWPPLIGDARQIEQLVRLLVENALRFRDLGRAPRIVVEAVEERRSDGHAEVVVRVHDNGVGLDRRHSERIFQPFERLHAREAHGGTGMGLAIGRRIAERHGGRIEVESVPGEGSVFSVHLPQPPPEVEIGPGTAAER